MIIFSKLPCPRPAGLPVPSRATCASAHTVDERDDDGPPEWEGNDEEDDVTARKRKKLRNGQRNLGECGRRYLPAKATAVAVTTSIRRA